MPSNNRRRRRSARPPHLTPAPVPAADEAAPERSVMTAAPGEDAPWSLASQVMVTLPQDEYMALLDKAEGESTSPPRGLLEVPARRGHDERDGEDAPFTPQINPPARQRLADVELGDEQQPAADAATHQVDVDPPRIDGRQGEQDACSAPADHEHTFRDEDPDPDFEKLALASSAAPARSLAPGSASIDTPGGQAATPARTANQG